MSGTNQTVDTNSPSTGQVSAEEVDATLDQVDKELADLESMLAETVAEVEAESPSGASPGGGSAEPLAEAESGPNAAASDAAPRPESVDQPEAVPAAATQNPPESGPPAEFLGDATSASGDSADAQEVDTEGGARPDPTDSSEPADDSAKPAAETASQTPDPGDRSEPPRSADEQHDLSPEAVPSHASEMATRVLRCVSATGVSILVFADKPFAGLRPGLKMALGYVGIGTLIIAIATWIVSSVADPS